MENIRVGTAMAIVAMAKDYTSCVGICEHLWKQKTVLQQVWRIRVGQMSDSNMKSEHNLLLACEDSPQRAFFFCTFSGSLLALLASTVHRLRFFLNAANRRLCSVLDSAKHIHCRGPAALSYPSSIVKKHHSSLSSIARLS